MNVKYVYPANVQAMLDEIDKGIKYENERLAKQFECIKNDTGYAESLNMQIILNNYNDRVAPLIEAKSRILNNVPPMQIILTKQEQTNEMNNKQEIYNLSAESIQRDMEAIILRIEQYTALVESGVKTPSDREIHTIARRLRGASERLNHELNKQH